MIITAQHWDTISWDSFSRRLPPYSSAQQRCESQGPLASATAPVVHVRVKGSAVPQGQRPGLFWLSSEREHGCAHGRGFGAAQLEKAQQHVVFLASPHPILGPAAPTCLAGPAFWDLDSDRCREQLALLTGHEHLFPTRLLCNPHRTALLHTSAAWLSRTAGSVVIIADSCKGQVMPSMTSQGVPRRDRPHGFAPAQG